MADLFYSQRDGFTEYTLPKEVEWHDGESIETWRERTGYLVLEWRLGDQNGDFEWSYVKAHGLSKANGAAPRYYVEISDGDSIDHIFVGDAASLMALRIHMATLATAWSGQDIRDMKTVATRAFRAWHGHESYDVCRRCDPHAEEGERRRIAEAEKKKAGAT